jgi:Ca2+-transporting ATPase
MSRQLMIACCWAGLNIGLSWKCPISHAYLPKLLMARTSGRLHWKRPDVWRQIRGGADQIGSPSAYAVTTASRASNSEAKAPSTTALSASTRTGFSKNETMSPFLTRLEYNSSAVDAGSLSMDELWTTLESNPEGLSESQASARLVQFGKNSLEQSKSKSTWQLILEQFEDRLVQILLVVALLSGVFSYFEVRQSATAAAELATDEALWKSFVEPLVILAILVVNAAVGVWQSQSASDSLDALQRMQSATATVLRDGVWKSSLEASDLVPGDIIELRVGDKIPADSRLLSLQSSSLQIDEGSLTGESVTVGKLPGDEGRADSPNRPVQDQKGMLYSGTMVTSGSGKAVVVQTGMTTQFGKIQQGVTVAKAEQPKTPLAKKLDEFGETLTIIIGVICLAVWIVSIPKMNDPSFGSVWVGAVYYAKVAVALGVAAIPEGLPAVITLCLSLGTRRMAERNVIVRKLQSVETLGCTSVICTDKTGTLTTNEMTVVSLVLLEHDEVGEVSIRERIVEGFSYSPVGEVEGIQYNKEVKEDPLGSVADVAAVCALCNDAKILGIDSEVLESEDEINDPSGKTANRSIGMTFKGTKDVKTGKEKKVKNTEKAFQRVGEPTEAALCILAEKLGGMSHYLEKGRLDKKGLHFDVPPSVLASANVESWREAHPRLATLEFSRDRKSMSVLCGFSKGDYPSAAAYRSGVKSRKAGNRLLIKGAPNLLIERCTNVKFRDGTIAPMTGALRRSIEDQVSKMAARPLRCLALAIKDQDALDDSLKSFEPDNDRAVSRHPLLSDPTNYRSVESGLTLVGIVGIKDPARPEVAESIKQCTRAGIRVMMITGDAKDTAIAIARDVNIFSPVDDGRPLKAYEGREFFLKAEREQLEILREGNIVFCRAEPADKQKLVKMLQNLDEIPAMTGDGVNDAPALQQAAIGIAMGITGTEVSKNAADMILADDNFSTIVSAVEEGRRIYSNMQAFICFLISCNIGEICAIFFATLAGFPEPLTAMHLLWVNLVTDGPPATALGFNPPAPDLMEQPPRPSDEPIMTRWLLTRYCITGLYVGLATIGIFAQHYLSQGITLAQLATWSQCGEFWTPPTGSASCTDLFQGSARMLPQTLALTTLVCMEMLKALSAVSMDDSIFRVGPQENKWLILGVSGPFLLHLMVLYSSDLGIPALGESFGMVCLFVLL